MDRKSVLSLALICIVFAAGVRGQAAPTTSPVDYLGEHFKEISFLDSLYNGKRWLN
ncbi:transmembrane protein, putative [Medicago truncatula]|uniref:Transmembrane protein, putative n=1 Tax=Medicago truncatula TaxID=3880 RepID=G7IY64_MEDTR|nr:transmembrane protein, putative [Medicago truncatula]